MTAALSHQDQNGERRERKQAKTFTKKVPFISVAELAHTYNLKHPVKPQEKKH